MTNQRVVTVVDVIAKLSMLLVMPFFALLVWNAVQLVEDVQKIKMLLTSVQIAQERCEIQIATTKERLLIHIEESNRER